MVVGLLRIRLHIPAARTLKDRRAVVRKAIDRVRARYPLSAAEVGDPSHWQTATLAFAMVTSDRALANEVLDKATATVASATAGEATILRRELQIDSYSDDEPFGDDDWSTLPRRGDDDGDDEA